jgi:hypothetical protein
VLRRLKGYISKERMDRCQPQVARAHADPVVLFQMVQKLCDQGRGDLLESKLRGPRVQVLLGELQQPTECIAIGGDGVRAYLTLLHQPLQEESLEQRSEVRRFVHADLPHRCSRRRIASRISSGDPLRYHWVSAT